MVKSASGSPLMLVLGLFWHYYRHREDPLGK